MLIGADIDAMSMLKGLLFVVCCCCRRCSDSLITLGKSRVFSLPLFCFFPPSTDETPLLLTRELPVLAVELAELLLLLLSLLPSDEEDDEEFPPVSSFLLLLRQERLAELEIPLPDAIEHCAE